MRQSRRSFLDVLSGGRPDSAFDAGLWIAARGHEDYQAQTAQATQGAPRPTLPPGVKAIRISSNENPLGPGKAALDAIVGKFPEAGRYPFNSTPADSALVAAIAAKFKVKPENIVLGAGSQEILKTAVRAFTSPSRGLVTAAPSFENCPQHGGAAGSSGRRDQGRLRAPPRPRRRWPPLRRAPAWCSSTTRTTRRRPCTAQGGRRFRATRPRIIARHGDSDRRGLSRLRDRSRVRERDPARARRRRTSSSPGRSRRRTAWRACASATRSARRRPMKPLAQLKMPYNVSVFGIAAALAALPDTQPHRRRARAQHRGPGIHRQGARRSGLQVQRLAGQLPLRRQSGAPPRSSATPARSRGSWWAAPSRRSKRPTRASRSARWKR